MHNRSLETPAAPCDTLDLCCGGKKCPTLTDDGDAIVIDDADQSPLPIRIAKSDVPRVLAWLALRASP